MFKILTVISQIWTNFIAMLTDIFEFGPNSEQYLIDIVKNGWALNGQVAQILTNFWRKTLILAPKTLKFPPTRMAQIIINFLRSWFSYLNA